MARKRGGMVRVNGTHTVSGPVIYIDVSATTGVMRMCVLRKVTLPEYDPWGPDEPDIYEVGEDDE